MPKQKIIIDENYWTPRKESTWKKKLEISNQYDVGSVSAIVLKSRKDTVCQGCHKKIPKGSTYYKNVFYPLFTGISHLNKECLRKVHLHESMGTPQIRA